MHGSRWEAPSLSLYVGHAPALSPFEGTAHKYTDNGGPPGVLYELLVACFYYGLIGASIAEARPYLDATGVPRLTDCLL